MAGAGVHGLRSLLPTQSAWLARTDDGSVRRITVGRTSGLIRSGSARKSQGGDARNTSRGCIHLFPMACRGMDLSKTGR